MPTLSLRTLPARPPRTWGAWLFAGVLLAFWGVLALSGADRFEALEPDGPRYVLKATQLEGVTRLRIEGDSGADQDYWPVTRVLLGGAPEVVLSFRFLHEGPGREKADLPQAAPPLVATREGDTLVLRWVAPRSRKAHRARDEDGKGNVWMDELVLPAQFQALALSHAAVQARTPLERLQVSGRQIEVDGPVAHLDLRSTHCKRCGETRAEAEGQGEGECGGLPAWVRGATLAVRAERMQSVRIVAAQGAVALKDSQHLQQLDLQLGDSVALSLDRAGALGLLPRQQPSAGAARKLPGTGGGAACNDESAPPTHGVRAQPLDLVLLGARPAAAD
ncbi:hypothetical protein [Acidovorax sp.]|uniref:hypothetical protein n=1 Tax=Acidovorax sp. TaxID=1872122 RepID=UPI0025BD703D|nr:hypothetical protein [Acidovorax sp.]MBW8462868.1 hypothetical protein [Acidovorax sp.]